MIELKEICIGECIRFGSDGRVYCILSAIPNDSGNMTFECSSNVVKQEDCQPRYTAMRESIEGLIEKELKHRLEMQHEYDLLLGTNEGEVLYD